MLRVQFRVKQPELLPPGRPLQCGPFVQPFQERIQVDPHRPFTFVNQQVVRLRFSQNLSNVGAASAHATEVKSEPCPLIRVLQHSPQMLFRRRRYAQAHSPRKFIDL